MSKYEVCVYKLAEAKIKEKHIIEANNSEEAIELAQDKIEENSTQLIKQLLEDCAYSVDVYGEDNASAKLYNPDDDVSEPKNMHIYTW